MGHDPRRKISGGLIVCGIIGYVGSSGGIERVADGLRNLEYRGYDSVGVAAIGDELTVHKQEGRIGDLSLPSTDATCTIGHTRWSTHGEPTDENAHPHTDCPGRVAVVHNGIITNYDRLRTELRDRGHVFESETDTEVVPHLVEEALAEGCALPVAVRRAVAQLEGSYAIAVTTPGFEGLVAARQGSPLVIGYGESEAFLASDVTGFVEHTQRVTYLEAGDVAVLSQDGVTIYNDGERVDREIETVSWDAEAVEKGGYDHYMLKEIHEQPRALRQTLSGQVDTLSGTVDLGLCLDETVLRAIDTVEIVACGTSYHAGLYAKHLLERFADLRVDVTLASEFDVADHVDTARTLAVAVSQSGETADTLSAIRAATAAGMPSLAVTNTVGSTITRKVDDALYIRAGPEIGVAATKTFVSQVVTLGLLAVHVGRVRDALTADGASDLLGTLRSLPDAIQDVLDGDRHISRIADRYADGEAFFFIGRQVAHPVALESALKLKEISYDHAEGFAAGELKHGPLALVTEETPVVALLTDYSAPEETLSNVKEVQARGAPVVGLSTDSDAGASCETVIGVPEAGVFEPLVANVALQLFAYHVADSKGRAIDKPRNLAKSVTVE
jgi:glucosamine--fructose-6-phosphate aminotransferase (isomerizing)